jgi:hypothetical protein
MQKEQEVFDRFYVSSQQNGPASRQRENRDLNRGSLVLRGYTTRSSYSPVCARADTFCQREFCHKPSLTASMQLGARWLMSWLMHDITRMGVLCCIVSWQLYSITRLRIYASHLHESYERHAVLSESLSEARMTITQLRNRSASQQELCARSHREHMAALADTEKARAAAQIRLDEELELNSWLNQTSSAREAALRTEGERRAQAESTVLGLREEMNLLKGQLLTAQQQQGTLHSKRKGIKK